MILLSKDILHPISVDTILKFELFDANPQEEN